MAKKRLTIITNIILIIIAGFCMVAGVTLSNKTDTVYANGTMINGAYYSGDKQSKNVALMINVYWGTEYLDGMLDTLNQFGAKCTFFVGGSWANTHTDYLEKIVSAGHELANHGYYHKEHEKLDAASNRDEIYRTHEVIKNNCKIDMNLFAPPGGSYNKQTVRVAAELGYKTIMWTRDTIDWRDKDATLIYSRAIKDMAGGDLILMHPTSETAKALPDILRFMASRGFVANTVTATIGQN